MTVIFACLLAFVLSLGLTFPIRKVIAPKFGFMDVPRDPRHIHKKATPLIGGLGIYMVKKSMDDVTYEYKDGQNILAIKKNLQ